MILYTCFGYFGHAWLRKPKVILSTCRKLSCLFAGKKSTSPALFFWRYCKDMQTSYFGYFGHAWLHTPKMIVSTCTRLWCLSVCKKQTSSFILFLRYYILKNPAIWLAVPIWGLEFCQIWDWWWNINNNISFHFRLFPRKTNDKIFQKIKKPNFGAILGPFSWSKGLSVVRYSNYLPSYKKSAKTIEPFLRKTPSWRVDRRTDGQTDNGDFIGPSVGRGPTRASVAYLKKQSFLDLFQNRCS